MSPREALGLASPAGTSDDYGSLPRFPRLFPTRFLFRPGSGPTPFHGSSTASRVRHRGFPRSPDAFSSVQESCRMHGKGPDGRALEKAEVYGEPLI
jgi:hypothetical protein